MKKIFIICCLISMSLLSYSQVNNIVIEKEKLVEKEDKDIGGVDYTYKPYTLCIEVQGIIKEYDAFNTIHAVHYNPFPVTVSIRYRVIGTQAGRFFNMQKSDPWNGYQKQERNETFVLPAYSEDEKKCSKDIPIRIAGGQPVEVEQLWSFVKKLQ